MMVSFQKADLWNAFLKFNEKTFPLRDALKISEFRYKNSLNPLADVSQNVIALDDQGEIVGQALYHPAEYFFEGKRMNAEWGFDFYVEKKNRSEAVGLEILNFIKNNKSDSIFATGVGKKALKIQKFYGYFVIGEIIKYYRILNPLFFLPALLPKSVLRFPEKVKVSDRVFSKVKNLRQWKFDKPINPDLLEFERSSGFMSWRFFSDGFDYSVYASDANPNEFFVVRAVKIKNVSCLVLVDFRSDLDLRDSFSTIVAAAEKIARKLWLPIVVSGSSLKVTDSVFESKGYKVQGENRPIVTNSKNLKAYRAKIDERSFALVTLADSDGEYLFK